MSTLPYRTRANARLGPRSAGVRRALVRRNSSHCRYVCVSRQGYSASITLRSPSAAPSTTMTSYPMGKPRAWNRASTSRFDSRRLKSA